MTTLPSTTDNLWRHIEDITDGHVNVRSEFGAGYSATLNGHHGDRIGKDPYNALVQLAKQIDLPATREEWIARSRAESTKWFKEWENSPPIPNPYPDIPSEYLVGLDRGKLGDWLQEVHDAGWYVHIRPNEVRIFALQGTLGLYVGTDDDTHRVDVMILRAYLAWLQGIHRDGG